MRQKIEITRSEMKKILTDYGHHSCVRIPVILLKNEQYEDDQGALITEEWRVVMNNGMVYNPFAKKQVGVSSNTINAKRAIKYILDFERRVNIYSSVFNHISNTYVIVD